ncbi:Tetratricopeptide repeat protein 36 [Borealophlyctis nickersoniae]|nr:Tetratricopeptide repeat protein 36 [Borealophlyctis nickersoniae]
MQGRTDEALADLDKAVELGAGDAVVLKQAYTQRAILRKSMGDLEGSENDFAQGARLGNEIAKAAVANNPYAKM